MNPQQQGGVNLGSAYGQIVISDNIDAAMQNAGRAFDNALSTIGGRMDQIGQTISGVGQQITIATAPLAIFGAQGVRVASSYQDALKEIEVRAGLTEEQLAEVAERTREIGLESQYGPAEAADAFLQLLSSGSSVEEAMLQIDGVIQGASASGSELGYTADALTDIMAAFGEEASASTGIMQTLINATSSSSATFPDLVDGFSNVGPAARNAGLSVEETAAALAVFAENGIKGAEGGTQLKTVLTALQSPRAAQELERLGVSITDVEGNIRPLNDIIVDLNGSMATMSESERNAAIQELAGSYGQLGLSALLAQGGIDDMMTTMSDQADLADVAEGRLDTFSGQLSLLRGSIELLQVAAFEPFMNEVLRPMVERIRAVVDSITQWIMANPELAGQIIRVLAIVTAMGPILVIVGQAISFIGGAIAGLGTLIGIVLSPIGLLIGAIALLGAAFATNFMGIRDAVMPVINDIIGTVNQLFQIFANRDMVGGGLLMEDWAISNFLFDLRDAFTMTLTAATSFVVGLGQAFQSGGLQGVIDHIGAWINLIGTELSRNLSNIDWAAVGQTLLDLWGSAISLYIQGELWIFNNIVSPLLTALGNTIANTDWAQVGTDIMNGIGTALSMAFDFVLWLNDNVLQPMLDNAQTAIEGVDWFAVGEGVVNAIGFALTATFDFIGWIIDSIFSPITDNTDAATGEVDWAGVGESILNAIGSALETAYDFINWLTVNVFVPLIAGAVSAIAETDWSSVADGMMNAIASALPDIITWVTNNIITPINNALANFNPMNAINNTGEAIGNAAQSARDSIANVIPGYASGTDYVPFDMLAMIHQGEQIIPASQNPNNPASSQSSGGPQFNVQIANITANNAEEGRQAGEAFGDAFLEKMRNGGYTG